MARAEVISLTEVLTVDPMQPDMLVIRRASELIRKGGLVAFPTETVYGLGADALNPNAVKKIFSVKGRPADNPLIVHIADRAEVPALVQSVPKEAEVLIKKFFPGPLTLVLRKKPIVPDETTAKLPTVAIRMPDHRVALSLIKESGTPIAAPSANTAGRPSPTKAQHVLEDLCGKVDMVIDGGWTGIGLESTVLDLTVNPPRLLRPGGITLEALKEALGEVRLHPAILRKPSEERLVPTSPGMKYRHYAPRADLIVVVGKNQDLKKKIQSMANDFSAKGFKVGIAALAREGYHADHVQELGRSKHAIAKRLFSALRSLDRAGVDVILAEGTDEVGLGLAIMNRLKKASGHGVVRA